MKYILYWFIKGQANFEISRHVKIQIQKPPPSMHHKWKEIMMSYPKQPLEIVGDQLLAQSPIELKDNSIVKHFEEIFPKISACGTIA